MAGISSFALAGPYDGVYQAAGSTQLTVVLQSGTTLGAAALGANGLSGIQFTGQGGRVLPSSINTWVAGTGPIVGNVATISGVTDFGACNTVQRLTFNGTGGMVVESVSSTLTAFGTANFYSCVPTALAASVTLSKVF